jgi:ribosomal protein L15E
VALSVLGSLVLLGYIAEYAMAARFSYQRAAMRRELYHLRQETSNLRARVATLERPSRIDALARAMGMKQRNHAVFVTLAPRPAETDRSAPVRPTIAGFLPDGLLDLFHQTQSGK